MMSYQNSGERSSSGATVIGPMYPDGRSSAVAGIANRDYIVYQPSVACPSWASVASLVPAPLILPRSGNCTGNYLRRPTNAENHLPIAVDTEVSDRKSNSNRSTSASSASATNSSPALASRGSSKGSSNRTSLSSPVESIPSSATSASNIETPSEVVSDEEQPWPSRWFSSMKKTLRTKLLSVTGRDASQAQTGKPCLCGNVHQQTEDDLKATLFDLQRRYKRRQIGLPDLDPGFDHAIEVGKLHRRVFELDFSNAEMIIVASDMTTCMQVPLVQFWGDVAHVDVDLIELAYQQQCQKYFRARLSRRVEHRTTWLKLQSRHGSAREIEDWYREVVGLIGWRDEAEACLPWSWRENGNWL
jgi:hypothetical protein